MSLARKGAGKGPKGPNQNMKMNNQVRKPLQQWTQHQAQGKPSYSKMNESVDDFFGGKQPGKKGGKKGKGKKGKKPLTGPDGEAADDDTCWDLKHTGKCKRFPCKWKPCCDLPPDDAIFADAVFSQGYEHLKPTQ